MMKRFFKLTILLVVLGLGAIWLTLSEKTEAKQVLTVSVERGSFDVDVRTVGTLEARRSTTIASEVKGDLGKIIEILPDGKSVKKGDLLVRLDPSPFEQKVVEVKAKVMEEEAHFETLHAVLEWEKHQTAQEEKAALLELRSSEIEKEKVLAGDMPLELSKLETNLSKAEKKYHDVAVFQEELALLEEEGLLSPGERRLAEKRVDEEKENFESASIQHSSYVDHISPMLEKRALVSVKKAEVKYEETLKSSAYRIAKAEEQLYQSEMALEYLGALLADAELELQKSQIRAPTDGMVVLREEYRQGEKRRPRVGDIVLKNQPLIDLPDLQEMIIKTKVREVDLHKIAKGQRASIQMDAYPTLTLSAEVVGIGVLAQSDFRKSSDEKYFDVKLLLKETDERLRPGMTARVVIHSSKVKDQLTLPVHAIFYKNDSPFVFKIEEEQVVEQPLVLGASSWEWVEVKEGLEENDFVRLLPP